MSKHTKGPWVVDGSNGAQAFIRPANNADEFVGADHANRQIFAPLAMVALTGSDFSDANALLVAAAPEMLEALKQLTEMAARYVSGTEGHYYKITQARAAIAKAEGKG